MTQLNRSPHYIFWLSIPLLLFLGFLQPEKSLQINIHATYFVIILMDLIYLGSMIFALIGLGYWLMLKTGNKMSAILNIIHIALTFGGIALIWGLSLFYRDSWQEYKFNDNLTLVIYICIFAVIIGQLFFPINIIRGLIWKKDISLEKQ